MELVAVAFRAVSVEFHGKLRGLSQHYKEHGTTPQGICQQQASCKLDSPATAIGTLRHYTPFGRK